ncbi:MAG: helix-turn-helix transcriptional regulator [Armatimonadota bacterium]
MPSPTLHLYDPRRGEPALRVDPLAGECLQGVAQKWNYFSLLWIQEGQGTFWADLARHPFQDHDLLCFTPYQTLKLLPAAPVTGIRIQFHANFFCIEAHHEEVGCNGVLFNDLGSVPVVRVEPGFRGELGGLVDAMRQELAEVGLAHTEILISYLKILLVRATRIKLQQQEVLWEPQGKRPPAIDELRQLIEAHFRTHHKPRDYAALLCLTPGALARLVQTYFHTTPTQLIRERILRAAKWELLHTTRPVKQIAHDLGYADVFYFSRIFKQAVGCSPTFFREYETEIRGGRDLSIPGPDPSILP